MIPMLEAVDLAAQMARRSPCAKSKRGVVVYDPTKPLSFGVPGYGFNGPPEPIGCDGSERCRATCGKRCVHAEVRALRKAIVQVQRLNYETRELHLVHVKIGADGELVAGGGPSCWQCSREIVDVGIDVVWLFERTDCPSPVCPMCTGSECRRCDALGLQVGEACDHATDERHVGAQPPQGAWQRYTAAEFHAATCRACEVY